MRKGLIFCALFLLAAMPVRADDPYADCQPPVKWKEVIPKGGSLTLYNWCHHEEPDDIDPKPTIGTVIKLKPGQKIRIWGTAWNQATKVKCGKQVYGSGDWHKGTDLPVGGMVVIKCEKR